jgi:Spy/CpxP family protein refolding chaperone
MSSTIQRTKAQAIFFLLGAVLVGGALGFTADRAMVRREGPKDAQSSRAQLGDRLQLTAVQRQMLDSVLDDRNERMKETLAPVRPRLDSLRGAARAAIRGRLTPEQQLRWDEVLLEMAKDSAKASKG